MSGNEVEGLAREVAGKVEDAAGVLSDDGGLQLKGKARQLAGKAQAKAGDALDEVRELTAHRPLGSVLVAAGVGFVLGVCWARRD